VSTGSLRPIPRGLSQSHVVHRDCKGYALALQGRARRTRPSRWLRNGADGRSVVAAPSPLERIAVSGSIASGATAQSCSPLRARGGDSLSGNDRRRQHFAFCPASKFDQPLLVSRQSFLCRPSHASSSAAFSARSALTQFGGGGSPHRPESRPAAGSSARHASAPLRVPAVALSASVVGEHSVNPSIGKAPRRPSASSSTSPSSRARIRQRQLA